MNKHEIIADLSAKHAAFAAYINSLNEKEFTASLNQKWTAGQQLEHIYKSVFPLARVTVSQDALVKMNFGMANRASKSYDLVIGEYEQQISKGAKATAPFEPATVGFNDRAELLEKLQSTLHKLNNQIENFTEQELDDYLIPHPLLGKLTLREMLYFTGFHVVHHHRQTINNLELSQSIYL